jgi:hypothetical protein
MQLPHPKPRSAKTYIPSVTGEEYELEEEQILESAPEAESPGVDPATASSTKQVPFDPREDHGKRTAEQHTTVPQMVNVGFSQPGRYQV